MVAHDMKFLVLGLLCLVEVVWCRTCVSQFDDIKSRALASDIVLEGRVQSQSRLVNGRYNATIKLPKKKKIYKGADVVRRLKTLTVAGLGSELNAEQCSAPVDIGKTYILFLTTDPLDTSGVYRLARLPAKVTKKNIRDIRKIVCKKCDYLGCPEMLDV